MVFKFISKIIFSVMLLTALVACKEEENKTKLIMGTSADYPPFESMQNGEFVGLDIDVARAICKELKYELVIKDMDFAGLIPALNSGVIDFAISTISPTEERKKNVDFSNSYYKGYVTLISKKEAPIHNLDGLKGKTLGVQLGSVWETYAKGKEKDITGLKIFSANRIPQLIEELKIGRIDAFMIEEDQADSIIKKYPNFTYAVLDDFGGGYAIAFIKGSQLQEDFNRALSKLEATGELEKIRKKWLKQK